MSKYLKLLDLPRTEKGTKIYLPEDAVIYHDSKPTKDRYILFYHIDGMYSYCKTQDGGIMHLSAVTPLEKQVTEDGKVEYHIPPDDAKVD